MARVSSRRGGSMAQLGFAVSQQWRTEVRRYECKGNDKRLPPRRRERRERQRQIQKPRLLQSAAETPALRRQRRKRGEWFVVEVFGTASLLERHFLGKSQD